MQYHSRALRHHREAPALEQDGRAEAALELEELADRGDRDPPLLDPDGAPVADDLALDEPRPRHGWESGSGPTTVSLTGSAPAAAGAAGAPSGSPASPASPGASPAPSPPVISSLPMRSAASRSFPPMVWA